MKNLLITFSVLLVCFSCNQKTDTNTQNEMIEPIDPMAGVWEQTNYYFLVNGDTVFSSDNNVQHKIYMDGYIMWTSDPQPDSSEWHGFGTYSYNNGILTETLKSMSIPMRGDVNTWDIKVNVSENSFSQIIETISNDTTTQAIEVYKRLQ